MPRQYLNPLGFIDKPTETGATFILTDPEDSRNLEPGTPVTIWRYSRELLALDRIRGEITRVGYTTAVFTVTGRETADRWPKNQAALRENTPVYLALKDSFEPDMRRMLSPEQAASMAKHLQRYAELTGRASKEQEPGGASGTEHLPLNRGLEPADT